MESEQDVKPMMQLQQLLLRKLLGYLGEKDAVVGGRSVGGQLVKVSKLTHIFFLGHLSTTFALTHLWFKLQLPLGV